MQYTSPLMTAGDRPFLDTIEHTPMYKLFLSPAYSRSIISLSWIMSKTLLEVLIHVTRVAQRHTKILQFPQRFMRMLCYATNKPINMQYHANNKQHRY